MLANEIIRSMVIDLSAVAGVNVWPYLSSTSKLSAVIFHLLSHSIQELSKWFNCLNVFVFVPLYCGLQRVLGTPPILCSVPNLLYLNTTSPIGAPYFLCTNSLYENAFIGTMFSAPVYCPLWL